MHDRAKRRGDIARIQQIDAELTGPPLPVLLRHVWRWFGELQRERSYTGMGDPLPLSARDIKGWMDLYQRRPDQQELEMIRLLDTIWLNVRAESRKG
ncbi:phage tail assembly chaperone [Azospirillum thermophilum]|uniref:Uncharacterized protein n=1 Tax=Azospirillum thermophilum TaxID=2202148 RepID=A0A2S2CL38_9PROT|nr:hypothetical protein [Azospirillum thermophilum]AWK85027.1 hypothetical protein DEW08_01475 [Azospirillum thermophilum]